MVLFPGARNIIKKIRLSDSKQSELIHSKFFDYEKNLEDYIEILKTVNNNMGIDCNTLKKE